MIPVKLELKNFLSYKKEILDFTKLDPITLIVGVNGEESSNEESNGSGKSSLLDSVEWVTYGRVRGVFNKDLVKDDIIHKDQNGVISDFARVVYIFELEKIFYKIIREKNYDGATVLELFTSADNIKWKNFTLSAGVNKRSGKKESSISRTQERINDILNANCDLFINSVFFEQQNTNTFALSKQGERVELLREALYLEKWIDYGKEAKSNLIKIERELYGVKYSLDQENSNEILEKINELKETCKDFDKNCKIYNVELQEYIENLKKLDVIYQKSLTDIKEKENQEEKIDTLQGNLDVLLEQFKLFEIDILDEEEIIKKTQLSIGGQNEIVEKTQDSINSINKELENIVIDKNNYLKERDSIRDDISTIKAKKQQMIIDRDEEKGTCPINDPKCYLSSQEAKEKRKNVINAKLFKINGNITRCQKKLKTLEENIKDQKDQKDKKEKSQNKLKEGYQILKEHSIIVDPLFEKIKDSKIRLVKIYKQKDLLKEEIFKVEEIIKEANNKLENFEISEEDISKINLKINLENEEKENLREKIIDYQTLKVKTETNIEILERKINELKELEIKFKKLNEKFEVLNFIVKMVTKDIPYQLIEAAIPEIEIYAQEFIDHLSGGRMNIFLTTQKELKKKDKETKEILKTDEFNMLVEIDGIKKKYSLCSGGEKTRADIAIHLAYSAFIINRSGAKLQTLFLDEVASALDKDGKNNLISLLNKLIKEYNFKSIFLISQDVSLNKKFDSVLTIKKTNEGSKVYL